MNAFLVVRYAVHAKVTSDQTTMTFQGRPLDDQQTSEIIQHFNDAIFIERYYIFTLVTKSVFFIHRKDRRRLPCKQSLASMM
ncbi:hypothetical protein BsIDN1_41150 [Bacillus safensis]|uniref:Uncharacterized protein n=1 Tax=Bacillus safensis TaxID=561879 RepID=A0A5S9MAH4_BACIA|nr:hypothetical protein BsIDN1_41150 [Bacillus safensis]